MVKRSLKGKRLEREARKILEKEGYIVETKPRTKWGKKDFFCFDLVAVSKSGGFIRWVQVKANYCPKKEIERIRRFKLPKCCCSREVWIHQDRKGWRKIFID